MPWRQGIVGQIRWMMKMAREWIVTPIVVKAAVRFGSRETNEKNKSRTWSVVNI
jgi:hypothetical protein